MEDDGVSFSDESVYSKEERSIKHIVLSHLSKISNLSSSEFVKGYWEMKPFNVGGVATMSKIRHEDTREAYCNAIEFLVDLVYPLGDSIFRLFIDKLDEQPAELELRRQWSRKIFKQINIMFERVNFFKGEEGVNE